MPPDAPKTVTLDDYCLRSQYPMPRSANSRRDILMKQKQYNARELLTCLEEAEKARLCSEVNVWRAVNILSKSWLKERGYDGWSTMEEQKFRVNGDVKWLRLGRKWFTRQNFGLASLRLLRFSFAVAPL
jgi:hypothetical protein